MPGVPCATRYFRSGAIWSLPDRSLDRARRGERDQLRRRLSRQVSRKLLGQNQPPSPKRNRCPHRLLLVSPCELRSRSELRRLQPRHRQCRLALHGRPRLRARPIRSRDRRPQHRRQARPAPARLHPQRRQLQSDRRRLRRPPVPLLLPQRPEARQLPSARLRLRRLQAPLLLPERSQSRPPLRPRLHRPDLQDPQGSAHPTRFCLRTPLSRQSGWLERSSQTWWCTIPANARKDSVMGT